MISGITCLNITKKEAKGVLDKMKEKGLWDKYGITSVEDEEKVAMQKIFTAYWLSKDRKPGMEDKEGCIEYLEKEAMMDVPQDAYDVYKAIYDELLSILKESERARLTYLDEHNIDILKDHIAEVLSKHGKSWNAGVVFRRMFLSEPYKEKDATVLVLKEPIKNESKTRQQEVVDKIRSLEGRVRFNRNTYKWEKLNLETGRYEQINDKISVSDILYGDSKRTFPTIASYIGTQVDAAARLFFDKTSALWKDGKMIDDKATLELLIEDQFGGIFTVQGLKNLLKDFQQLEGEISRAFGKDCQIISSNIKMLARSTGRPFDHTDKWVIGEPDLLVVDKYGKVHVLDIKTHKISSNENEYIKPYSQGSAKNTGDDYNRQLYHYIKMLRSYGFDVDSTPYLVLCDSYYDSRDESLDDKHVEGTPEIYKMTGKYETRRGYIKGDQEKGEKDITLGEYAGKEKDIPLTQHLNGGINEKVKYIQPRLHVNLETGEVQSLIKRKSLDEMEEELKTKNVSEVNEKDIIADFKTQYDELDEQSKKDYEDFAGMVLARRPVGGITKMSEDDIQAGLMATQELKFLSMATMSEVKWLLDEMARGKTIELEEYSDKPLNNGSKTKGKTHAEIIKMVGIDKLVRWAFESRFGILYNEDADEMEYDPEEMVCNEEQWELWKQRNEKIRWIRNHFNQFKIFGAAKLMSLEKSIVPVRKRSNKLNELPDPGTDPNPDEMMLDDGDNEELRSLVDKIMEGTVDTMAWSLGNRNYSAKASLAQEIAKLFENLSMFDEAGHVRKDTWEWGCQMMMDSTTAIQTVMEACHKCRTMEAMDSALDALMNNPENRGLEGIRTRINADEMLKTKFFRHFRKDFTVFSSCQFKVENGKRVVLTRVLNMKSAFQTMMNSLGVDYERGKVGTWKVEEDGRESVYSLVYRDSDGHNKLTRRGDKLVADLVTSRITKLERELKDIFQIEAATAKNANKDPENAIREGLKKKDKDGKDFINKVSEVLYAIGLNIPYKAVLEYCSTRIGTNYETSSAGRTLQRVREVIKSLKTQSLTEGIPSGLQDNNAYRWYKPLVTSMSDAVREHVESSTYDGGKTYYSYCYPSKLQQIVDRLTDAEDSKEYKKYIHENFGRYTGWFKTVDGKKWLNDWMRQIEKNEGKAREAFAHKVEVSYLGEKYDRMGSLAFQLSILTNYFGTKEDEKVSSECRWFAMTTMSNKPVNEFLRMLKYKSFYSVRNEGMKDEYYVNEDIVENVLMKTFQQECNRIADVLYHYAGDKVDTEWMDIRQKEVNALGLKGLKGRINGRIEGTGDGITEEDLLALTKTSSGAKFHFLWYLNKEMENNREFTKGLVKKINLLLTKQDERKKVDLNNEADFLKTTREAIERNMSVIVDEELERMDEIGLFDTVRRKQKDGTIVEVMKWQEQFKGKLGTTGKDDKTGEKSMREELRDFIWQDIAANINIIQITGGDLAYYGTPVNYQKRIAQVHSPGLPLMHNEKYDDGYLRSVYISDDKHMMSETVYNAKAYLQKQIDKYKDNDKEMKKEMQFILELLQDVNVTDGQSFNCPTSIMKKMHLEGDWDDDLQRAYDRIASNNYDINDLRVIIQPSKPFNTAEVAKYSGSTTMKLRRKTIQAKNSEYLILLADALARADGKRSKMAAIHDFMEQTVKENNDKRKGIDTVHFNSVGKVGVTGVISMQRFDEQFDERLDKGKDYKNGDKDFNTLVEYYLNKKHKNVIEESDYNSLLTEYLMMHVRRYNEDGLPSVQKKADYDGENSLTKEEKVDGVKRPPILSKEEIHYNSEYVDAVPVESYIIQQEVPAHLLENEQLYGSQIRILGISDITPGTEFHVGSNRQKMSDKTLIDEYKNLHAENIRQAYNELLKEFGLDKLFDEKGRVVRTFEQLPAEEKDEIMVNLEYLLQKELSKDMKYDLDTRRACTLVRDSDGHVSDFVVPLMDPVQSNRIQMLLNSIIKKTINKQKIRGGSTVQVTAYDNDLHVRFQDKNGKILQTLTEYEEDWIKKNGKEDGWEKKAVAAFEQYLKDNQAGIAWFECYMSVPNKALEALITKRDGSLMTVKEIQEAMPEVWDSMSKIIGYRIPTENKYSMVPLKIVGFLPKGSGQAIMMPKEITRLTGSDFDIDKMYLMMKEFLLVSSDIFVKHGKGANVLENILWKLKESNLVKRDPTKKEYELFGKVFNNIIEIMDGNTERLVTDNVDWGDMTKDEIKTFIDDFVNPLRLYCLNSAFKEHVDLASPVPEYAKRARDNRILDLQWAVLTNEDTAVKMLSPGNFEELKRVGRIIKILKAKIRNSAGDLYTWEELDELYNKVLERDGYEEALARLDSLLEQDRSYSITLPSTKIYFQRQNMQGMQLVGICANNNVSHAFCSFQNIYLDLNKGKIDKRFSLFGKYLGDHDNPSRMTRVDPQRRIDGGLVSETLAKVLSAAVDVAKDPCTKDANIDTFTAGVAMTMARLGFTYEQIGMFLSQPVIVDLSDTYFTKKTDGYYTGEKAINEVADILGIELNSKALMESIAKEDTLTEKNLKEFLNADNYKDRGQEKVLEYQGRVLQAFSILFDVSRKMQELTFCTKFNSVSNAVGPTIADTEEDFQKVKTFMDEMETDCFFMPERNQKDADGNPITFAQNVISDDPILKAFYDCTMDKDTGLSSLLFKQFFPHYFPGFQQILEHFKDNYTRKGRISAKLHNQLLGDYIYFMLTHNNILLDKDGKNSGSVLPYEKLDVLDLVEMLPNTFREVLKLKKKRKLVNELIDNELGSNCITLREADSFLKMDVLLFHSGRLGTEATDAAKDAWSDLVTYNDPGLGDSESKENRLVRRFGIDLFFYNLMRNGFSFHPQTMMTLASVLVRYNALFNAKMDPEGKKNFVDYISGLRMLKQADNAFTADNTVFIERSCNQFVRNHSNNKSLVPTIGEDNVLVKEGSTQAKVTFSVKEDDKNELFPIMLDGEKACRFVSVIWKDAKGKTERVLYELESDVSPDFKGNVEVVYKRISMMGITNKFIEYNANEDVIDSIFDDKRGELDDEREEELDNVDVEDDDEDDSFYDKEDKSLQEAKDRMMYILDEILKDPDVASGTELRSLVLKTMDMLVNSEEGTHDDLINAFNELLNTPDEDEETLENLWEGIKKEILKMNKC